MALNDGLERQPIPSAVYSVLFGPRVVTLHAGEKLVHIGGSLWARGSADLYFGTGRRSFSDLKAIGDLNERLRSARTGLRRDLATDHFAGRKRVSIEGIVVESVKAYAGRVPGLLDEVFYIPGTDDLPTAIGRRAIRVVRRAVIR